MRFISKKSYDEALDKLAEEYEPFAKHSFIVATIWTWIQVITYKWQLWLQGVKIVEEFIYEEVKAGLESTNATVIFQKVDGSLREMHCTLQPQFLPPLEEGHKSKPVDTDVLAVWDLDKNGWRSFRLDSVISVDYK